MCDYGSKRANAGSEPVRYMEIEPGPVFPTLSDGPSNTYTWWAGPLYKGVGPKDNHTNGVFMVHMSKTDQPTGWGIIRNFIGYQFELQVILVYPDLCTFIILTLAFL